MIEVPENPVEISNHVLSPDTAPLVSISCITYNQEKYISEAIEGFLMQKTVFPVEILIHDDASTDKTADIIREYEAKYPQLIKPIYQTENQFSQGNKPGKLNRIRARGTYLAMCEGDDYWTDPLKLQKQVNFLEANPEYSMVCTNFSVIDENYNLISKWGWQGSKTTSYIDQETILGRYTPKTLTVLLRNRCVLQIDPKFSAYRYPNGDVAFFSAVAEFGPCHFVNEITGTYRMTKNGIWAKKDIAQQLKMKIRTFKNLLLFYSDKKRLHKPIYKQLINMCRVVSIVSFKKAKLYDAGTYLMQYFYFKIKDYMGRR